MKDPHFETGNPEFEGEGLSFVLAQEERA